MSALPSSMGTSTVVLMLVDDDKAAGNKGPGTQRKRVFLCVVVDTSRVSLSAKLFEALVIQQAVTLP